VNISIVVSVRVFMASCYHGCMLFSSNRRNKYEVSRSGRPFGSSLLFTGLLSVFFGLAVIARPELLAYIVASFFIITGLSLLSVWWSLRR